MDMESRNQYLKDLVQKRGYLLKSKKEKSQLLDEYCQTTGQNRNYVIRKIRNGAYLKTSFGRRKKRKEYYDGYFKVALARVWEIFDFACGQRLKANLTKEMIEKLREKGELDCSDEVAQKLTKVSPRTIDEKLRHQKEVLRQMERKGQSKAISLLLKKIPIKIHGELDNQEIGNLQIDFVEHSGSSAAGEFVCTIDSTCIASGWEEWEAVMGRGQIATKEGLDKARSLSPFDWKEIHSDTDKGFVNAHLLKYCQETNTQVLQIKALQEK